MVLLIAIPLALIYLMVNRQEPRQRTDSAVATLRERYARGEIDDEEFETLRAKLSRRSDTDVN
ncbi:SHOCT domain-containing protein [Halomicrococcus sp. SG-WS-1]|uniref:SHOCT domain-containing protein n=1 Tax=Halomicrococcus sp. SG-WS-1 TaxID=3439057 RepID=UPI003F7A012C